MSVMKWQYVLLHLFFTKLYLYLSENLIILNKNFCYYTPVFTVYDDGLGQNNLWNAMDYTLCKQRQKVYEREPVFYQLRLVEIMFDYNEG